MDQQPKLVFGKAVRDARRGQGLEDLGVTQTAPTSCSLAGTVTQFSLYSYDFFMTLFLP